MSLNYTQACALRYNLLNRHAFADYHSLPSADAARDDRALGIAEGGAGEGEDEPRIRA